MKKFVKVIIALQFIMVALILCNVIPYEYAGGALLSIVMVSPAMRQPAAPGSNVVSNQSVANNTGDVVIRSGEKVVLKPAVQSLKITVTSPPNGAAGPTDIYLMNQRDLQNITTNGGAALVYNYPDGFNGTQNSNQVGLGNATSGLYIYGVYIRALADNVADPAGLSDTEPALLQYVGRGLLAVPYIFEIDDNETRADQDDSIGVARFDVPQPFDYNTQLKETINGDAAVTYKLVNKLYFTPNFKA